MSCEDKHNDYINNNYCSECGLKFDLVAELNKHCQFFLKSMNKLGVETVIIESVFKYIEKKCNIPLKNIKQHIYFIEHKFYSSDEIAKLFEDNDAEYESWFAHSNINDKILYSGDTLDVLLKKFSSLQNEKLIKNICNKYAKDNPDVKKICEKFHSTYLTEWNGLLHNIEINDKEAIRTKIEVIQDILRHIYQGLA